MAELTKKRDFSRVIAFHTQGKEIYWGFENLEPPYSEVIVKEFSRVSGYKAVQTLQVMRDTRTGSYKIGDVQDLLLNLEREQTHFHSHNFRKFIKSRLEFFLLDYICKKFFYSN